MRLSGTMMNFQKASLEINGSIGFNSKIVSGKLR